MSNKDAPARPFDPLSAWREWFVKSEREWSESLTRLMKEDATARAVGQEINAALYAHQMAKQGTAGWLASMNMPTQDQLVALGERLGALEDAVARVEASIVQLRQALGATAGTEPTRRRKAPPAAAPGHAAGSGTAPARAARRRRS